MSLYANILEASVFYACFLHADVLLTQWIHHPVHG